MKYIILILIISSKNLGNRDMVLVPGGKLVLKNHKYLSDTVFYVNDFYMDETEVTIGDFQKFILSTNYKTTAEKKGYSIIYGGDRKNGVDWRYDAYGNLRPNEDFDKYPVVHISWNDANNYAKWCNKRLPTEIEWIHAFREAKNSNYKYSGSNRLELVAVNSDQVTIGQVKSKKPNNLGIYDMSGNVSEMTCDSYKPSGDKTIKLAKGGSYVDSSHILEYLSRIPCGEITSFLYGFRCVK